MQNIYSTAANEDKPAASKETVFADRTVALVRRRRGAVPDVPGPRVEQLPGAGGVLPAGHGVHDAVRGAGGRPGQHPARLQHRVAPQLDAVM